MNRSIDKNDIERGLCLDSCQRPGRHTQECCFVNDVTPRGSSHETIRFLESVYRERSDEAGLRWLKRDS